MKKLSRSIFLRRCASNVKRSELNGSYESLVKTTSLRRGTSGRGHLLKGKRSQIPKTQAAVATSISFSKKKNRISSNKKEKGEKHHGK